MSLGRVGAYRIVSELGRGGLGAVYRAVDRAGHAVAIKCLIPSESTHADTRLLQESSLRIEHPNVVRTLGGGLAQDGRPYLVLELLEGVTLRTAFVGASQHDVLAWMRQAALGIAAVHAHGLVHRDVKPENLFLCRDGTVKVLDLGVAAWRDERSRLTATGAVIGTPAYLSPEQARGQRLFDPRIDVWALGVVLYEALAGQPPFRRDGLLSTLLAVAIDPLVPLDEVVPAVSPQLAAVIHRCLERNLEKRLPTATALADALERILAEPAATVPAVSPRPSELLKERSLSLLLSRPDPREHARFEALVRQAEGEAIFFADGRAIAVFGAQLSRGDEAVRALATARELVGGGGTVAIALGRGAVEGGGARGAVVHEAEEALARAPSGIVCGPKAAQALRRTADLQEIAPGLFQVGQPGPRATTITPLLSRDVELAMLRRARDAALEESRPVITWIIGSPGTGKTRLAESVRSLAAEAQPPTSIREAHARTASPGALSLLHRAFDIEPRRPSGEVLDATVLVDLLREASIEHIVRIADQGPLTVILEDLQWADPLSIDILSPLLWALEGRAVWLVITGRPELLERIGDVLDTSVRIEPAPLGARDAIEMARARGLPLLSLRAAQALVAHTGGNPLFLELILDAYGLEGAEGRTLEANESWEDRPLPATVEYAVQARLDQLGEHERTALACLALFGRAADAQELLELGVSDPEPSLELLAGRDLVSRGASPTGRTYRVRSPVVATVAAALPSPAECRVLHRRAAVVAEQRGRDFEEIAEHREAAGEAEAAAEGFLQAALGAVRGGDARKVLRCGARALACGLPVASNFALHAARIDAARWVGDHDGLARALDDGDVAAETDAQRALVLSERGDWLRRGGDPAAALVHFDRAVELAEATGELNILVRATCRRAIASVTLGRLEEAAHALSRLTPDPGSVLPANLSPATEGLLEDTRGFLAGSTGDLGLRRASFARAASLYTTSGDLRRAAGAESNAADAANRLGQYAEAEGALRRAIELARRVGNRLTEGYALANLGYALTAQGSLPKAIDVLGEAIAIARSVGERHLLAAARLYLCRADTSSASAPVLEELAGAQHSAVVRAGALALSARRALSRGEVIIATERALAALTLRDEAGELEEGEAEIFVAAINALDAAGRTVEASALRQRARARLDELAARIVDPVARGLFLERIPEHQLLDRGSA